MKTAEEIKKGLECCYAMDCTCIKRGCPYNGMRLCHDHVLKDARDYIQQLEADVKIGQIKLEAAFAKCSQLAAERDAAVADIEESQPCFACRNFNRNSGKCGGGKRCLRLAEIAERNGGTYQGKFFEWRGVQKEETK